jgi:CRISPR/Cas system CSM-associated protein Csm5 (group 7 of RAMP superfamily)
MLRNHVPDNAYKNVSIEDTKHSVSLLSSPQTQQLYHIEILYLPGCTIKGAVLRIVKETYNIKLAVHKYF